MKLLFVVSLFIGLFNIIKCETLPRYDTLSINGVDDNTCSRLFKLGQCQDICGPYFMQFISSENNSNQITYGTGNQCDSILTKVTFPCDPQVNSTFTINVNNKQHKYSPKCSCNDKLKCSGLPTSSYSSSSNSNSNSNQNNSSDSNTINIPIIISSCIPLLAFLFIMN